MQRQPIEQQLSRKSRGILYYLKKNLQDRKKTLQNFIGQLFDYHKQKFTKKQFQKLIKFYDQNLIYQEIDHLFDQLDDSKNGFVFFYRLKQVYKSINQEDNMMKVSKSIFKSQIFNLFETIPTTEEIIQEVRALLLNCQDLYQIIDIFAVQKSGFLNVQNVIQLLNSFQYQGQRKRRALLQYIFQNKNKVPIDQFIKKLDIDNALRRTKIQKLSQRDNDQKSVFEMEIQNQYQNQNIRQSRFVKDQIRKSTRLQQSINLDLKSKKTQQQFISIQKIPHVIAQYFNYGSLLEYDFAKIVCQYLNQSQIFIDTENPNYSKAFQWIHYSQITGDNYTLFKVNESVLIRDKNKKGLGQLLQSKDIIQGRLGDCYFLSGLSAVVQRYPQLVYRLFVLDKNPSHIYGIRLFIDGKWKTIIVDACFPIAQDKHLCAAQSYRNQIWVMLLQKAWAKVFGSYDNIHAGYNQQGLNALSGAPSIPCSSRQQGFLKKLQVHLNKGAIITCATSAQVQQMTDNQQDKLGIYSNHAYTLLSVYKKLPYQGQQITLLKIRNPWGKKQWKGDWSYYSSIWTNQLKNLLNYNRNPEDGTFFMDQNTFKIYFDFVNICRVNLSYINSYLTFDANRNQYSVISIKIKQKGDYFFTQYQQNPRKYKNSMNYKKSKAWMFLLKVQGDKRHGIGSNSQQYKDNTLQATLQPGQYILVAKMNWKFWQNHEYTLASYGPESVEFRLDRSNKYNAQFQISKFIQLKSTLGQGKLSKYDKLNVSKRLYFDPVVGYGFIQINNLQDKILNTTIKMSGCKGLTILYPYQLPIKLTLLPNQNIIVKFIVDPSGYAYQYNQSYYLEII